MDATLRITEVDRDEQGKIKVHASAPDQPRSLADLLPKPEAITADAKRPPWTRTELATLAVVALLAAFVIVYAWATPRVPKAAPTAAPTTVATVQPTSAPTLAPTAEMAALVAFFDYSDPSTVASITTNQITRIVGTAGDGWRLVDVGNARVWIAADQVPTGIPAADPLPDLTPRRPAPAPQPAYVPVAAPVAVPAAEMAATDVPVFAPTAAAAPTWDAVAFQRLLDATATAIYARAHEIETRTGKPAIVVPQP